MLCLHVCGPGECLQLSVEGTRTSGTVVMDSGEPPRRGGGIPLQFSARATRAPESWTFFPPHKPGPNELRMFVWVLLLLLVCFGFLLLNTIPLFGCSVVDLFPLEEDLSCV